LTEAAEAGDWKVAADQAKILQDELAKNTELLKQTRAFLEHSAGDAP